MMQIDSDVFMCERLDLHTVPPSEYAILAGDRGDLSMWSDRCFSNPHGHLVDDLGGWCRTGVYGAGVIASDGG